MKSLKVDKECAKLELTPLELDILRSALTKELASRKRVWAKVVPKYPEELIYHATINQTTEELLADVCRVIRMYQIWDIL